MHFAFLYATCKIVFSGQFYSFLQLVIIWLMILFYRFVLALRRNICKVEVY